MSSRMSVPEIAQRLKIGRLAVQPPCGAGHPSWHPAGRRWIVTRSAFEAWEKTCGTQAVGASATRFQPILRGNGVN